MADRKFIAPEQTRLGAIAEFHHLNRTFARRTIALHDFDTFDRTGSVEFPFAPDVVFRALETAVGGIQGMSIAEANAVAGHLFVKTSASAFSWGEKVSWFSF